MAETIFSSQEVCAILKACGEAKVSKLKFRDLYVEFGTPAETLAAVDRASSPTPATEIAAIQEKTAAEAFLMEEALTKAQQLELMKIEDPVEYEKLCMQGELEDDDGFDDEEA